MGFTSITYKRITYLIYFFKKDVKNIKNLLNFSATLILDKRKVFKICVAKQKLNEM